MPAKRSKNQHKKLKRVKAQIDNENRLDHIHHKYSMYVSHTSIGMRIVQMVGLVLILPVLIVGFPVCIMFLGVDKLRRPPQG